MKRIDELNSMSIDELQEYFDKEIQEAKQNGFMNDMTAIAYKILSVLVYKGLK